MSTRATGNFDVKLHPQPLSDPNADATLGRLSIDKQFHGDLKGTSMGEGGNHSYEFDYTLPR